MPEVEIKLYGTSWCPQTAMARKMLRDLGITFTWCDIEEDALGCAYVEKINRGKRSVPTIVFPDGTVLVEPTATRLAQQVKDMAAR